MKVLVETSAHHVHVSDEALEALFGKGATLTNKKDLSQPGQFACVEKVTVVGPRGEMAMSILGPTRPETQVEISLTDARKLGISAPVKESGCIAGTPGCKLIGPAGEYEISEGVIAAKRHIHFSPKDAEEFGVQDKQIVSVKVESNGRTLTFDDVVARVSPSYALAMHIDTDESNAAMAFGECYGEVIL
ncbi:MAG: phosphate propanoyltransferase [Oscillospiraceae bacterium]|nr:phosphate propanoyltransferase [Oscillospiraceae bacterium]